MSDFNNQSNDFVNGDFTKLDPSIKEQLNKFNQKKARNMSMAVFLYIFSVAFLIFFAAMCGEPIIGVTGMFICIAAATGLIVYTNMLIPVDLIPYIRGKRIPYFRIPKVRNARTLDSFMKLYWLIVTVIYLGISFQTGRWGITWLIWLIAAAVKEAVYLYAGAEENEE